MQENGTCLYTKQKIRYDHVMMWSVKCCYLASGFQTAVNKQLRNQLLLSGGKKFIFIFLRYVSWKILCGPIHACFRRSAW